MDWAGREGIPFAHYTLSNESLIPRGRNVCCAEFLRSGLQKLLFIDADVSWSESDLRRLYHSEKTLIGGTYPVKKLPLSLNVNPVPEEEREFFDGKTRTKADYARWAYAKASPQGEIRVRHLPTGFMMIDRSVLLALAERLPSYNHVNMTRDTVEKHTEFFRSGEWQGEYESEDWYFSRVAAEAGHPPHLNVNVILPHTGTYTFDAQVRR